MKTLTIWKKEVLGHATSPRAYVMVSLMIFFSATIFWIGNLQEGRDSSMRGITGLLTFLLLAITPILTMRVLAEENSRGTLELLLTSPVREAEIVLGKFLGVLTLYLALFAVTLVFPAILLRIAEPQLGMMGAQYLGMILCSMAFISVGVFASSITESQVIAAVVSYLLLLFFWIAGFFSEALPSKVGKVVGAAGLLPHIENFGKGIIDAVDVFYYLAFTAVFLFLAIRAIEARRWA